MNTSESSEPPADQQHSAEKPGPRDRSSRAEPVVHMKGAVSLIDRFPALAGVDLEVAEREIVLLRGPNGAGKSTLLRLCAGLAPLHEGRGTVLGHDLADRAQRRWVRRHAGILGHETFLYDELTVEDNVNFWVRANRVDPDTVEPVMERLGLNQRLRSVRVARLSAGQRRRTSLAVLVCRRPRLWLLDEPHAGLDANGRDFVDNLVRHAVGFGATVMFASHDWERADDIATRKVTIVGGQVREDVAVDSLSRSGARESGQDQEPGQEQDHGYEHGHDSPTWTDDPPPEIAP